MPSKNPDAATLNVEPKTVVTSMVEQFSDRISALRKLANNLPPGPEAQSMAARLEEAEHWRTLFMRTSAGLATEAVPNGKVHRKHKVRDRRGTKTPKEVMRAPYIPGMDDAVL